MFWRKQQTVCCDWSFVREGAPRCSCHSSSHPTVLQEGSPLRTHRAAELQLWNPGPLEQAGVLGNWCAEFWRGMLGIPGYGELHGPSTPQWHSRAQRSVSVYKWEDEMSLCLRLVTVTNRKGDLIPHREIPANSPSQVLTLLPVAGVSWSVRAFVLRVWSFQTLLGFWVPMEVSGFLLSAYGRLGRPGSRMAQRRRQVLWWRPTNNSKRYHYLSTWYMSKHCTKNFACVSFLKLSCLMASSPHGINLTSTIC